MFDYTFLSDFVLNIVVDLLAKFPPKSVRMNQPLHMQPWNSSPQLVKKLFKVHIGPPVLFFPVALLFARSLSSVFVFMIYLVFKF